MPKKLWITLWITLCIGFFCINVSRANAAYSPWNIDFDDFTSGADLNGQNNWSGTGCISTVDPNNYSPSKTAYCGNAGYDIVYEPGVPLTNYGNEIKIFVKSTSITYSNQLRFESINGTTIAEVFFLNNGKIYFNKMDTGQTYAVAESFIITLEFDDQNSMVSFSTNKSTVQNRAQYQNQGYRVMRLHFLDIFPGNYIRFDSIKVYNNTLAQEKNYKNYVTQFDIFKYGIVIFLLVMILILIMFL